VLNYTDGYVGELQRQYELEIPSIVAARARTKQALERLNVLERYSSADAAIVAYGSIGRGEVTDNSDADWTMLVDGPSIPDHVKTVRSIADHIETLGFRKPGPANIFGALSNSFDLVHNIAGIADTNQNLTRRVLLLVESAAITQPLVRERVLRNIIARYVIYDTTVPRPKPLDQVIPHFLLNDVVRYWRTMASDYAAKMWERNAEEWALRNVKLRFSRKLIFIAGLLICFSFELDPPDDREDIVANRENLPEELAGHILRHVGDTPLDLVARALLMYADEKTSRDLMESYDVFLGILGDVEKRAELKKLKLNEALASAAWNEARDASHRFREGVESLFLKSNEQLKTLMMRFAIF
jgi:hypothetical protein